MKILRASEDYLEAMLMMQEKHGYIRSIDIAEYLGVTKPSVSYIANKMLDRHHTLTRFLMALGIDEKTAEQDACKMEHDISQETFQAICRHAGREG